MTILRFAIEVLDVGYLVSDTTHHLDDDGEKMPDTPIAAFAPGDVEGAFSYIRTEIGHHESEVARYQAEMAARQARPGAVVLPGPGWKAPEPTPAAGTIIRRIKTDREIVDEVNAVALTLLERRGFRASGINPRTYVSLERQNPRIREAWENAVAVYEQITGSGVSDALQAVLEEEEAAAAPAVPAEVQP